MVEMLMCSSLGTVRGGPAVEGRLQTPRELKSASTGKGGTAVLDRGHSLCQEGTGEPRENGWLPPSMASPRCPLLQPGSSSFSGQPCQVLTGATPEQLEVVSRSKTSRCFLSVGALGCAHGQGNCSPYLF